MTGVRSFLALPLADVFASEISAYLDKIRSSHNEIRWVAPEQVHVTLHFFWIYRFDRDP